MWGRLGRSNLRASALTRLHEHPDEGSAAIVASVLADDTRADPELTARVADALRPQPEPRVQAGAPQAPLRAGAPSAPLPPRPTAPPPRAPGTASEVRKVWLLGLPQMILAALALSIAGNLGAKWPLLLLIVLVSAGLAGYGLWLGSRLLRRGVPSRSLRAAMVLDALVLIRLILWVFIG